jgi:hypothetical protein
MAGFQVFSKEEWLTIIGPAVRAARIPQTEARLCNFKFTTFNIPTLLFSGLSGLSNHSEDNFAA